MGGLPPDALDVLVRTMARVCENPYNRLFSMAMRDEDPQSGPRSSDGFIGARSMRLSASIHV